MASVHSSKHSLGWEIGPFLKFENKSHNAHIRYLAHDKLDHIIIIIMSEEVLQENNSNNR